MLNSSHPLGPRPNRIIRDHSRLSLVVESLKTLGVRIVLAQGSYDLVHIGHARYLEEAKRKGDVLIVGVDEDEKIRSRKGPERPIVPEDERLEMVLHLRSVDIAVLKRKEDPRWHLVKTVRPDVLIATKETYTDEEVSALKQFCGEIVVLERMATTSTSAKIRHLQMKTANQLERELTPKILQALKETLSNSRTDQYS